MPDLANKPFDVICVGDSTIDTFIKIHDASVQCDIHHEECKICVTYGDKIPVDAIGHGVAGNAANVAVGCKKLGLSTAIYTNLGGDSAGKTIMEAFVNAGISTEYVVMNEKMDSNLSVILTFQGERTAFVYHQDWLYRLPRIANTSWLYFTSVAESFTNSNIIEEICQYIDTSRAKLVYSPGTLQIKADVKRYPRILEKCEVLIVNVEEAKKILDIDPKEQVDIKKTLSQLHLLGPKKIVVTDGADGSYASDGQNDLKLGVFPVKVVEKTGAGDAYSAGLISALRLGKPFDEALVWGALNSASVIKHLGPQSGLLSAAELEKERSVVSDFAAVKL